MTTDWTITIDCLDVRALRAFWMLALGYVERPPPSGWDSWEDWMAAQGVPEDEWHDGAYLADPEGRLPGLSLLRVPEPKTAKNRVHLDLQVSGGRSVEPALREERIRAKVAELVAAGGTVAWESPGAAGLDHVTVRDPEGNELCVV
ncbi:VOC family protein [Promicromonospora sp. NPDC057488]|uniref:VOC family protein n=1 Tax=Promicromonospora sp. NPDC057488 TaxID=3346147 RepID=UPI003670FED6